MFLREAPHRLTAGRAIFLGPVVPAGAGAVMTAQMAVDGVEQRVQAHRFAAFALECAAGRGARRVAREMFGAESFEGRAQHGHLEAGDGRIVHLRGGAYLGEPRAKTRIRHDGLRTARALHFEHRSHVDEHDVQRVPARSRVRRKQRGIGREQRVHRADADEARAGRGCQAQQLGEIGEIADAPVVFRTQRVELHGHAPDPGAAREFLRARDTCRARR